MNETDWLEVCLPLAELVEQEQISLSEEEKAQIDTEFTDFFEAE